MEGTKILQADVLDILFENRNKDYGAYNLRKTYNRRIITALLMTASLAAFLFIGSILANSMERNKKAALEFKVLTLENLPKDKDPEQNVPPPPPPPQKQVVQQVETIQFTKPEIVEDDQVKPEDMPPAMKDIEDARIDVFSQDGIKDQNLATPPVIDDHKNIIEAPKPKEDPEKIFEKVEIEAEFQGGLGAWARYLQKNLNSNTPVDNGAAPGSYTVMVQFVVDKDGNISDVKALTNHGYGMEEEAIRAIKRGPQWISAIQNGRKVNAYRKQPITFVVAED
jgi:periplasmic protein TonB